MRGCTSYHITTLTLAALRRQLGASSVAAGTIVTTSHAVDVRRPPITKRVLLLLLLLLLLRCRLLTWCIIVCTTAPLWVPG